VSQLCYRSIFFGGFLCLGWRRLVLLIFLEKAHVALVQFNSPKSRQGFLPIFFFLVVARFDTDVDVFVWWSKDLWASQILPMGGSIQKRFKSIK
jgi:hypothetical protein